MDAFPGSPLGAIAAEILQRNETMRVPLPDSCPAANNIHPAAPPHVSPPAISSFGGLRTPALKPLSSPPPPSPAGIRKPSQTQTSDVSFDVVSNQPVSSIKCKKAP